MSASTTFLKMLTYVKGHMKEITSKEDREIIQGISQTKIFTGKCSMRELATLMRLRKEMVRNHSKS